MTKSAQTKMLNTKLKLRVIVRDKKKVLLSKFNFDCNTSFTSAASVGLGFLQFCNLNSYRTMFILGFSLFMGLSVPQYFNEYLLVSGHGPVHTGSTAVCESLEKFFQGLNWIKDQIKKNITFEGLGWLIVPMECT